MLPRIPPLRAYLLILLIIILSLNGALCGKWEVTFNEEFEGSEIDPAVWNVGDKLVHHPELECYLKENVYIQDGNLVIRTDEVEPRTCSEGDTRGYNYTSGWLETSGRRYQRYGKFVVTAKLPPCYNAGIWPAFWMLPENGKCWPTGGEIDIMEMVGYRHGLTDHQPVLGTYHWADACHQDLHTGGSGEYPSNKSQPIDWSKDYHDFAIEWDEHSIVWKVDEHEYWWRAGANCTMTHNEMYFIINVAISPWDYVPGEWKYPVFMYIDSVKWYKWVE